MLRFSLVFLTFLAACAPQSGVLSTQQTGLAGSYSEQVVISNHPRYVLRGHLIDVTRDGDRVRALMISHRRDGVNRVFMREAWSNGVGLPFRSTTRRLDGCTHGHCLDHSVGLIALSDRLFAYAAIHGLDARLIGYGDAIDIYVPPSLFAALPDVAADPDG